MPKPLYDVVIYEIATRKIESMAGTSLPTEGSFHTVGKRLETVSTRINDRYDVLAVAAGKYQKGDILPEDP